VVLPVSSRKRGKQRHLQVILVPEQHRSTPKVVYKNCLPTSCEEWPHRVSLWSSDQRRVYSDTTHPKHHFITSSKKKKIRLCFASCFLGQTTKHGRRSTVCSCPWNNEGGVVNMFVWADKIHESSKHAKPKSRWANVQCRIRKRMGTQRTLWQNIAITI